MITVNQPVNLLGMYIYHIARKIAGKKIFADLKFVVRLPVSSGQQIPVLIVSAVWRSGVLSWYSPLLSRILFCTSMILCRVGGNFDAKLLSPEIFCWPDSKELFMVIDKDSERAKHVEQSSIAKAYWYL